MNSFLPFTFIFSVRYNFICLVKCFFINNLWIVLFSKIVSVFDNVKQVILEDKILFKVKNGSVINNIFGEDVVLFKDSDNKVIALYRVCDDDKSKLKAWKMFL